MTLRHLKIFLEVCRTGSITRAAEELNMAQPAVSYTIRELESFYATRLFERMNRRLYITESGEQLMSYADSILAQFDEAQNVLRDRNVATKVRIGTNVSYGVGKLPKLVSGFRKEHPEIPIYTKVQNSAQIEEELMKNGLDFGIIDYPLKSEFFFCSLVEEDEVTMACSPDFQISSEPEISELKEIPLLLRENGSKLRNIADQIIKDIEKEGTRPLIAMESTSMQSLVGACLEGLGLLVLPKNLLVHYLETGQLKEVKISEIDLSRQYYLVYHKSKFLTKSMKTFKNYIMLYADKLCYCAGEYNEYESSSACFASDRK